MCMLIRKGGEEGPNGSRNATPTSPRIAVLLSWFARSFCFFYWLPPPVLGALSLGLWRWPHQTSWSRWSASQSAPGSATASGSGLTLSSWPSYLGNSLWSKFSSKEQTA